MTTGLAKVISRLFDLYTWSFIIYVLALSQTGLTLSQFIFLGSSLFLLEVIFPVGLFILFLKKKLITDIDLTQRRERPLYFFCLFLLVVSGSLLGYAAGTRLFFLIQLVELFLIGGMILITLFWKISGHLMINAAGIFFLNYFFGGGYWWLFILLLPVGWSRWYLHKHDFWQLLAGALLGFSIPIVVFWVFGFLYLLEYRLSN